MNTKKLLNIIILTLFLLGINTIKTNAKELERENIGYLKKEECNYLIDENDYNLELIEQRDKQLEEDLDENIIMKEGQVEVLLDVNNIKYIGISNVKTSIDLLTLYNISLKDSKNNEIKTSYYGAYNVMGSDGFKEKRDLIFIKNDGYVIISVDDKVDLSNVYLVFDVCNYTDIESATLFMSSNLNHYTYTKKLSNKDFSRDYSLSEFTKNSYYIKDVYNYYEKKYMCYKEVEKESSKEESDQDQKIVSEEKKVEENKESNLNNNVKTITYKESNNRINNKTNDIKEVKTKNTNTNTIIKENKYKNNNKKREFILWIIVIISFIIIQIIYYVKKCRTK